MSPDGRTTRELSPTSAHAYAFSADGRTIYGIRGAPDHLQLFSMSVARGAEKTIRSLAPALLPVSALAPALRLTLTPDGKSVTYSTGRVTSNLWLIEGLDTVTPP